MVMVVPTPSLLDAQMRPPWSPTIFFTIESPIPLPPVDEFRDESVR